jgi:UDP:flavonoid glycosyltransferase YjiC (YdhE family)
LGEVLPRRRYNTSELSQSLQRILNSHSYAASSRHAQREMAREQGGDTAAGAILRALGQAVRTPRLASSATM